MFSICREENKIIKKNKCEKHERRVYGLHFPAFLKTHAACALKKIFLRFYNLALNRVMYRV